MNGPAQAAEVEIAAVIPVYNRAKLVKRAIQSVLDQTHRPAQVVVVDDGSTDNTPEVCREFSDAIEYIRQTNRGVSAARNAGIRVVRHAWTAFLDSDDYWMPDHLEKTAAAITATAGQARFYFSDIGLPPGAGCKTLWEKIGFQFSAPLLVAPDATEWMLSQRQPCSVPCSVFKTAPLKAYGGFDLRHRVMEDTEIFCRFGIGSPVCAVNALGGAETADDATNNRLTGISHSRSVDYWEHDRRLWSTLLARFPGLRDDYRRGLRYSLAVADWRLSRLHWSSGRFFRSGAYLVASAITQPPFFYWLLRHGRSCGWEASVFRQCRSV